MTLSEQDRRIRDGLVRQLVYRTPVQWTERDPAVTRQFVDDYSLFEDFIGWDWARAFDFTVDCLLEKLYMGLELIPTNEARLEFMVFSVAAHQMEVNGAESAEELDTRIQMALNYLRQPTPALDSFDVDFMFLAHSAHFLLDPAGFIALQSLRTRIKNCPEPSPIFV